VLRTITIDNNYLSGDGYTIFVDDRFTSAPISGVKITNNYLGKGFWGYYSNTGPSVVSGSHELGTQWPTPASGSTISDGIIGNDGGAAIAGLVSISDVTINARSQRFTFARLVVQTLLTVVTISDLGILQRRDALQSDHAPNAHCHVMPPPRRCLRPLS
jgi:hypothetical protein